MAKRALITGIAGQDGTYLTELLVGKGYEVYGLLGPEPGEFLEWAAAAGGTIRALQGDLTDMASLLAAVEESRPDEVYNLAAMSFAGESWQRAVTTTDVNATGVVRLLEAVRTLAPQARFFQPSSAEIFGNSTDVPQTEQTPIQPRSPYGATKAFDLFMTGEYRETHGMHASSGILFNHESPRRPVQFVTRKITDAVARIRAGLSDELRLGNLEARRDWGFAGDYVEAMWLILQADQPSDYIVATGEAHSVREFCEYAFARVGLDWERYVATDQQFVRPAEVDLLVGDASKAKRELGWEPRMSFKQLVEMMVDADVENILRQPPAATA